MRHPETGKSMSPAQFSYMLNDRLSEIEHMVNNGASIQQALKIAGTDENQVRRLLNVPDPVELTLTVLTAGLTWKLTNLSDRVESGEQKFEKLIRTLGYTEKDGEFISTALIPALKKGANGDDKSFYGELLKNGMDHDEIVRMLRIVRETSEKEGITNKVLFAELATTYNARFKDLDERVSQNASQTAKNTETIGTILGMGEGDLNIPGRVRAAEDAIGATRTQITEINQTVTDMRQSSLPLLGIAVGSIAGFIVFLWVELSKFGVQHTTSGSPSRVGNVVTKTTHTEAVLPWFPQWAMALGFGIATACVIIGLFMLFQRDKQSTTSKTTVWSSGKHTDSGQAKASGSRQFGSKFTTATKAGLSKVKPSRRNQAPLDPKSGQPMQSDHSYAIGEETQVFHADGVEESNKQKVS